MRTGLRRPEQHSNPIVAAVYGAFAALILTYGGAYFLTRLGFGMINAPGRQLEHGPATLMRAGLNMYGMLHTPLWGTGQVQSAVGEVEQVSAIITLPLTVWALVPIAALVIGGYAASKSRVGAGRWGMLLPAVFGGILYAVVLAILAPVIGAKVDSSALPAVGGYEFNPYDVLFRPIAASALFSAGLFGVVFTYVGGLIAVRGETDEPEPPGKWWAAAKAVILVAVAIQVLMAVGLEAWFVMSPRAEVIEGSAGARFTEMLPTATGIGYSLLNGAALASGVESSSPQLESTYRPVFYSVNLYTGITSAGNTPPKPLSPYVYLVVALAAIGIIVAGSLAVRWGSRDGSVPTAARVAFMHSGYLAFLIWACRIAWQSTVKVGSASGQSEVFITPAYTGTMLLTFLAVFVLAFIGTYTANRKYARAPGFLVS